MPQHIPTIYLVRTESVPSNGIKNGRDTRLRGWHEESLDDIGKSNLPKLANFFTANPIKHVVTADLPRHVETAAAIALKHKTSFTPTASFRPWDNANGSWKDRPVNKSLHKEMQWYVDHQDKKAPGGESFQSAHSRLSDGLDAVTKHVIDNPSEPIAVVTSSQGIGSALFHLYGNRSHLVGKDIVAPGGVVRLQHDGKKWNMSVMRKGLGNKPALPHARYGSDNAGDENKYIKSSPPISSENSTKSIEVK